MSLARLFRYAKSASAVENFTTEALAAAIRIDPTPLMRALKSIGVDIPIVNVEVDTQVAMGDGILDLLVTTLSARRVVVEVKVDAGESGDQLRRYLDWAHSFPADEQPHVVVLGPRQITTIDGVRWLSWQTLWKEIRRSSAAAAHWLELATWLEECNMADDSYEAISPTESGTLDGAHRLLKKAARILTPASKHMNDVWQGSNWPTDIKSVTRQITRRFRHWPSYSIQHQAPYRAGLSIGAFDEGGQGWLGVWVWALFKRPAERAHIQKLAKTLPAGWENAPASAELVGAYKNISEFAGADDASEWIKGRINELSAIGMFQLIEGFGREVEQEDVDAD